MLYTSYAKVVEALYIFEAILYGVWRSTPRYSIRELVNTMTRRKVRWLSGWIFIYLGWSWQEEIAILKSLQEKSLNTIFKETQRAMYSKRIVGGGGVSSYADWKGLLRKSRVAKMFKWETSCLLLEFDHRAFQPRPEHTLTLAPNPSSIYSQYQNCSQVDLQSTSNTTPRTSTLTHFFTHFYMANKMAYPPAHLSGHMDYRSVMNDLFDLAIRENTIPGLMNPTDPFTAHYDQIELQLGRQYGNHPRASDFIQEDAEFSMAKSCCKCKQFKLWDMS